MKLRPAKTKAEAFTIIELLIVICIVVVVAVLLLPSFVNKPRPAYLALCMSNQKQIALALIMYADDYNGRFPWEVSSTNGGSMELISSGRVSPHFKILSAYYKQLPYKLVCPADKSRIAVTNASELTDQNISYFLNMDAPHTNNPSVTFLTGDRNLWADPSTLFNEHGFAVGPGLFVLHTNYNMSWTQEIHVRGGNLAFADGHVQFVRTNDLNLFVRQLPFATNRLCIP